MRQQAKDIRDRIKELTRQGRHKEACLLYDVLLSIGDNTSC